MTSTTPESSIPEPSTPVPNTARMRKELAWMEEQAELGVFSSHEQHTWVTTVPTDRLLLNDILPPPQVMSMDCGTKTCLCGHMAVTDGAVISWVHENGTTQIRFDGLNPYEYGARALGITRTQADRLFHPMTHVSTQRRLMEEIAGERL